ncbi:MAG: hypothetical protein GY851_34150, partial [bacterium]|nr:hypothetical protein [bacterium]
LGMHYDSSDRTATHGGTYKGAPSVQLLGSGDWKTQRYVLDDVRFGNGQNGGADFRLFGDSADLCIQRVTVTRH